MCKFFLYNFIMISYKLLLFMQRVNEKANLFAFF